MKRKLIWKTVGVVILCVQSAAAQRHEVGFTLGGLFGSSKSGPAGSVDPGTGFAFQANYGFRLFGAPGFALLGEVNFMASPLQDVASTNPLATANFASLYVTPGIRLKLLPSGRFSPYAAVGGGYALFEQSVQRLDGLPNNAPRYTSHGALDFGGGVDVKLWHFVGARFEVRDFYSGNPSWNIPVSGGGFHNLAVGGGLVLRLGL